MDKIPVIALFDIGKTNKKIFLFDEHYRIVFEKSECLPETKDEDGFPTEDINSLKDFILNGLEELLKKRKFQIRAVNISSYGASLVYIDEKGTPIAPLYNYLKPYPKDLEKELYDGYGGADKLALKTASPASGSLNAGLQLYRIKREQPDLFKKIHYALHLPQYLSSLITGKYYSDITSLGCHTQLWDLGRQDYHRWVLDEGLDKKLAPLFPSDQVLPATENKYGIAAGIGLHDSSAALIPYLANFTEPFILISTGTWCISLNPFNHSSLTEEEIRQNCLCYISYKGTPVKAARLFAGYEHEQQANRIVAHFHVTMDTLRNAEYDRTVINKLNSSKILDGNSFEDISLDNFENAKEAYHALMMFIVSEQFTSTSIILQKGVTKKIFVDGGFGKNAIYMNLLAAVFPEIEVYAASMAQATALGTALAIHESWNNRQLPNDIIDLKYYSAPFYAISMKTCATD
ncbi:FGGY-family carbohydrate kinase [Arachidicoccus ginsenosidivorans]|jgi:sugar (pentulose or hexulose) kinase|uniref:Carbohydrate kinase n=1 Tax=Arachidicoccus ginsenosidivorans TaxID=496057 RepID=A0A5B8VKZ2_9BACT|nr:FGGY family carbohydrate kinase [Arachidicoccus ginsenosidivorans]QEC71863.1 carbohydrate kinase [Arachidicoccus ginsenosidivorans]